jgi:Flp pilus assembly CpaE family ATPase
MRFIRSTYPLSIVDFGRSISPSALDSLPELEALYLITTPDFMSLESARRAIHMVEERGFAGNRLLVLLNKVKARETPDLEGIRKLLGCPCDAVFRSDHMSLYDAWSEGRFLPATSALGKELHVLADSIRAQAAGRAQPPGEKTTGSVPVGGKRWFSFLQKGPALQKTQEQGAQA